MRLMDRYLLVEYLKVLLFCFCGFSMLILLYDLFDNLSKMLESAPSLGRILLYYVCRLAPYVEFILPASLMLSTLYTLWQMARTNELTAMRACGVSLYRLMAPFLLIGLTASLLTWGIKETVAPWALRWTKELTQNDFEPREKIIDSLSYFDHGTRYTWSIAEFNFANPRHLKGVTLTHSDEKDIRHVSHQIIAEEAVWLDGVWWFYGPRDSIANQRGDLPGTTTPAQPKPGTVREMPHLNVTPEDLFIKKLSENSDLVENRSLVLTTRQLLRELNNQHPDPDDERTRLIYDIHRRLATPWACFIVTLFAIPAGAKHGRQNPLTSVIVAVGFFFGFYLFGQLGLQLGKHFLLLPRLGAWLPNLVFSVAGLGLAVRMR